MIVNKRSVVVIEIPFAISQAECEKVRHGAEATFPNNTVVVIGNGAKIKTLETQSRKIVTKRNRNR